MVGEDDMSDNVETGLLPPLRADDNPSSNSGNQLAPESSAQSTNFQPLSLPELLELDPSDLNIQKLSSALDPLSSAQKASACVKLIQRGMEDSLLVEQILNLAMGHQGDLAAVSDIIGRDVEQDESEKSLKGSWQDLHAESRESLRDVVFVRRAQGRLETWLTFFPSQTTAGKQKAGSLTGHTGIDERRDVAHTTEASSPAATEMRSAVQQVKEEDLDLDDPWAEADEQDTSGEEVKDLETYADVGGEVELDDDPWNDAASDDAKRSVETADSPDPGKASPRGSSHPSTSTDIDPPPISLSGFLFQPVLSIATIFARNAFTPGLTALRQRHAAELYPYRLAILDEMPDWISPSEIGGTSILPVIGPTGGEENWQESTESSTEHRIVITIASIVEKEALAFDEILGTEVHAETLSSKAVFEWYQNRINSLDSLGQIGTQLAWVQRAGSSGVAGLDETGENLSLLSRLVYDSHLSPALQAQWSLAAWLGSSPQQIVNAYLCNSSPDTIVADLRRLVLPYLYVLESRAERAGKPDPDLVTRQLREIFLSLPLHMVLPLFEQCKATLPKSERIIKDDQVVARLALACLYGSSQKASSSSPAKTGTSTVEQVNSIWVTMSAIFECLPVWDVSDRDPEDDAELTSTTLDSIAAFLRPSTSQAKPPSASDLYMFFSPLPFAALSRALDILDIHLESGEILSRWAVPVELRFLLQSARDGKEQIDLAERLVRTAGAGGTTSGLPLGKAATGGWRRSNRDDEEEAKWNRLWGDMLKLNGGGDQLLRGAFGMIDGGELMRVYIGGLLRSGSKCRPRHVDCWSIMADQLELDTARKIIRKLELEHGLKQNTLETVVLATSRELYEGADTGNIHTGDMKIAYDCLSLAPSSSAIATERAFIEATSRLSTFALPSASSHKGGKLSPQEILHTKNRLDLIALVLAHSSDAFRHEEMMLDLATKLGLKSQLERGRVWGMLGSVAGEKGEWDLGAGNVEKAVHAMRDLRKHGVSTGRGRSLENSGGNDDGEVGGESSAMAKLRDQIWRTALVIGGSDDWSNVERKLSLLGTAVELCPSNNIPTVLGVWRKVEEGRIKLDTAAKRRRLQSLSSSTTAQFPYGRNRRKSSAHGGNHPDHGQFDAFGNQTSASPVIGPGGSEEEERMLGSRRAAKAAKLAFDLGGRLGSRLPALPVARSASPSTAAASAFGLRREGRGSFSSIKSAEGSEPGQVRFGGGRDSADTGKRASAEYNRSSGEYSRALNAIAGLGGDARGTGGDGSVGAQGQAALDEVERVRRGARRALRQGVGWLLGAEEGEI